MAKALQHPATLKVMCPANTATFVAGVPTQSAGPWFTLSSGLGSTFLYWEGSIDLAAYVLKDLTWVTTQKDIQEPGNFQLNFVEPQRIEVIEFISNTQLNRDRLITIADDWEVEASVPGMMGSRVNFENIIDGRWRQFSPDSTLAFGSAVTMKASSFGSCEPSASEALFAYVIVKFDQEPEDASIFIPGRRFLLGGAAIEESELAYIMRLRRSYVLQQEVPA
jgi:hypothetical protein